jgi:hypothetical protein
MAQSATAGFFALRTRWGETMILKGEGYTAPVSYEDGDGLT